MPEQIICVGKFRLDLINECLWHGTKRIHQTPKDFAVLRYLVSNPGRLVRKEEILHAVWSDTVVSEGSLKVCIRRIRQVLNDNPVAPRFIETQPRRGYWFIAPVQDHDSHSIQHRRPTRRSIVGTVTGKS
jgi:DNA-binding winged helix-turn-helix (wHTH) protein